MKKTVQVLILPTNQQLIKAGDIYEDASSLRIAEIDLAAFGTNHVYFVSDEELKEGDWYINKSVIEARIKLGSVITKCEYEHEAKSCNTYKTDDILKVIATTDKSLNLPLIPQEFIKDYVTTKKEYRKEATVFIEKGVVTGWSLSSPKKQTLEEAAEEYIKQHKNKSFYWSDVCNSPTTLGLEQIESFIAGAKTQKENNG